MEITTASTIETKSPRDLRIGEAILVDRGEGRQTPSLIAYLGFRRAARQRSLQTAQLTGEILTGMMPPNQLFAHLLQPHRFMIAGMALDESEIDTPRPELTRKRADERERPKTSHFNRYRIDRSQRALKNVSPGTRMQLEKTYDDLIALRSCFQFVRPGKKVLIESGSSRIEDEVVAIGVGYRGPVAVAVRSHPDRWVDLSKAWITLNDKDDWNAPRRPSITIDCLKELVIN